MDLKEKVAIVTGSATGVGAATAIKLAERGARVVVNFTRSEKEARETLAACEKAGAEAIMVQADVARDEDCRRMAQAALDRWGSIELLVNNAGVSKFADARDLSLLSAEDFQRIYAVNVIGAYQMTRACAPAMKAAGFGAIVNVSSIAGVMGVGSSIAYAASKGALNTMTLSLARALGPEIRVNAICPGFIESRWLLEGYGREGYEALRKRYQEMTPLGRTATPEKVADAILFLLSGADLITGEMLILDSGMHLGAAPLKAR